MQNEIEMLRSIRQSTEMGCSGIRAVLDPKVSSLSTRLLQTEQANIEEMKHFL